MTITKTKMWIARAKCGCIVAAQRDSTDREERIALANNVGQWLIDDNDVGTVSGPVKVGHDANCKFHLGDRR
jgi:hypothetical protein